MRRYGWLTFFLVAAVAVTACLSGVVSTTQPPIPLYNGATVRGIRPGTYGRGARIPTEYAIKYHIQDGGGMPVAVCAWIASLFDCTTCRTAPRTGRNIAPSCNSLRLQEHIATRTKSTYTKHPLRSFAFAQHI